MYNSKLAEMINYAVQDCITYGGAWVEENGIKVYANWMESETEIEIAVYKLGVLQFTFVEEIPEEYC